MRKLVTLSFAIITIFCSCKDKEKQNTANSQPGGQTETVQQSEDTYMNQERDYALWALGNEPFWSLIINQKEILLVHNADSLRTPPVKAALDKASMNRTYSTETEAVQLSVEVEKGPCSDTMSDNIYNYSVNVKYRYTTDGSWTELRGCGGYFMEEGLPGKWELFTLMGKPMKSEDFGRDIPSIELQQRSNRFSGSTGCNRMNGLFNYGPDEIGFAKVMMTKALCGNGQENEDAFLKNLSAIDAYILYGDKLSLLSNGKEIMTFQRVSEE